MIALMLVKRYEIFHDLEEAILVNKSLWTVVRQLLFLFKKKVK